MSSNQVKSLTSNEFRTIASTAIAVSIDPSLFDENMIRFDVSHGRTGSSYKFTYFGEVSIKKVRAALTNLLAAKGADVVFCAEHLENIAWTCGSNRYAILAKRSPAQE